MQSRVERHQLEDAEWRYVLTKINTEHIVPLSRQAVALFCELYLLTGTGHSAFPGGRSAKRPMSDNAILAAMRRMGVEKIEMTGHGFRTSYARFLIRCSAFAWTT